MPFYLAYPQLCTLYLSAFCHGGNNLAPSWKRAVGMAVLISVGNMGCSIGRQAKILHTLSDPDSDIIPVTSS